MDILETIKKSFSKECHDDLQIQNLLATIRDGKGQQADVYKLAKATGEKLSDILKNNSNKIFELSKDELYTVLSESLGENTALLDEAYVLTQKSLYKKAGIGLNPVGAGDNQNKIKGLVLGIDETEDELLKERYLGEPVKLYSMSRVDEALRKNAKMAEEAGFKPTVDRECLPSEKTCKWCRDLAGRYIYGEEPENVWHRHENCRCKVKTEVEKGKLQDAWSKKITNKKEAEKRIEKAKKEGG